MAISEGTFLRDSVSILFCGNPLPTGIESLKGMSVCAKTPTEKHKKSSLCSTLNNFGKGIAFGNN
jgi:hypothetical protein